MSTYPYSGELSQSARYVGEFVPDYDTVQYFYRVAAYDRSRNIIAVGGPCWAFGPQVLDGDHAISIQWLPVIGASFYNVFKALTPSVPADESLGVFWNASASETGVLDVGYPCTTRNSFLNPGVTPFTQAAVAPPPPVMDCTDPNAMVPCPDPNPNDPNNPCPQVVPQTAQEIDYGLY